MLQEVHIFKAWLNFCHEELFMLRALLDVKLLLVWALKLRKHQYKLRAHSKAVGRLLRRGGGGGAL